MPRPADLPRFAVAVTCIDGRVAEPLTAWARASLGVDFVDMATQPGPDRFVAEEPDEALAPLLNQVAVSQRAHGTTAMVVIGHHDCAGNPVDEHTHHLHIVRAADRLRRLVPTMSVSGVWVGPDWTAAQVA